MILFFIYTLELFRIYVSHQNKLPSSVTPANNTPPSEFKNAGPYFPIN